MRQHFPSIDHTRHLSTEQLAERFGMLSPSPRDKGTVTLLHARAEDRIRVTPPSAYLDETGMPEDAWGRNPDADPNTQLTVMNHAVGAVIANGQSFTLFGDNLIVDLDLSEDNLPAGSRLKLGAALVEVTPEPHTGCNLYAQRFGTDALRFISEKDRRSQRLRGIHFRVVEPGEVAVGDTIEVLHRGG